MVDAPPDTFIEDGNQMGTVRMDSRRVQVSVFAFVLVGINSTVVTVVVSDSLEVAGVTAVRGFGSLLLDRVDNSVTCRDPQTLVVDWEGHGLTVVVILINVNKEKIGSHWRF